LNFFIPIHSGVLQPQHVAQYNEDKIEIVEKTSKLNILVCGFSPRAQHICLSPFEEERKVDVDRLAALNSALEAITDVSGEMLLSAKYAGTPPSRMYRSFVSPRPKANHLLEPVERAASRTASQIELALRQVRADEAQYLRNNDRSVLLSSAVEKKKNAVVVVLDNLRSAFNVGSIFRTAETAGIEEIVTCGITPHPPHPKLRKTAFTALDVVQSSHFDETFAAVQHLKSLGYTIVVMETTSISKEYTEVSYPQKTAVVLGNEITGVDPRVIECADLVVEIPTFGVKNSLNVASAAPIVLFEILRQWKKPLSN
jgi:tRNA G18 (ribose-2'-O)-methylase SpoU